MELHIQKCQKCGSRSVRNILVRDEQQKVFVQCRNCHELVARYILASGGYYHAGKGFESFLRSIERDGALSSGRGIDEWFQDVGATANEEFENLKTLLNEKYGKNIP
jgi:hypothetical protein